MIAKRSTAPLTVCVTVGGLVLTALPAHAAAMAGQPALACIYQVINVSPGAMLNVRSGADQTFGPIGTLRASETPVAGACTSVKGWVQVKTADAVTGWVPAGNLRKLTSPPAVAGQPTLTCTYRVTHVNRGQYVNVRSGAGKTFGSVGRLRVADGRLPGACTSVKGWVQVKTANAVTGWVSAGHLRKVRKTGPAAVTGRSTLACSYRVTHVRRVSFLNVRSGAGLRFHPVGRLRVADGRIPGACTPARSWVKVKAANGKRGWASTHYLRKLTK
ncbi:SH3 domain-containing protein [Streptosporangium subroseum]|uniref:SH3 domain-containing protein n=1 Tax=Streptosporangium subroseum TaxID=106412 RepID=UPI003086A85D|nr:SH3 domain-containing protein [Streptosporangium subroseum]